MRFISKYAGYKTPGIHSRVEPLGDGTRRIIDPGFMCEFQHGDLTDAEREFARTRFVWKGLPTTTDGQPLDAINDLHRVSVFDTASINDPERRKQVEQALLAHHGLGQDFVLYEKAPVSLPYNTYLEHRKTQGRRTIDHVLEDITGAVQTTGVDPAAVVAWEKDNPDAHSDQIIQAMEALQAGTPDEPLVAA